MSEADIFGKLSRIFETHAFSRDNPDYELDDILDELDPLESNPAYLSRSGSPARQTKKSQQFNASTTSAGEKVTPYDVWQEKYQKTQFTPRTAPKLSAEQWDRLVEKMHQSNRVKQSAMIREQNNGLASELGGYLFKPRINKRSLELSVTMKSLHKRLPEMLAESEKERNAKAREAEANAVADCTFQPKRVGEKMSSKYLAKSGRKKITPDDLIAYQQEKNRRIDLRKQILEEVEAKECTFRPAVSEKTLKIHEKLKAKGVLNVDPVTRTAITSPHKPNKYISTAAASRPELGADGRYEEGPMLVIESEHPYRNNTSEFTTVHIPGAVHYTISFHPDTRTEPVYDFVKFYDDETHTHFFGAGKYSGGLNGTPCNWPGVGGRPPLVIPASKFIIHFKTNGSVSDWGFRMHVLPVLMINNNTHNTIGTTGSVSHGQQYNQALLATNNVGGNFEQISVHTPAIPAISDTARNFVNKEPVHSRLYKHAVQKQQDVQSQQVELLQNKLNISLKPWEISRSASNQGGEGGFQQSATHSYVKLYSKTHLPKMTLADIVEEMVVGDNVTQNLRQMRHNGSRSQQQDLMDEDEMMLQQSVRSGSVLRGGGGQKSALMVVEFDESLSSLWKQLRVVE